MHSTIFLPATPDFYNTKYMPAGALKTEIENYTFRITQHRHQANPNINNRIGMA
jgi:hypothetical protein